MRKLLQYLGLYLVSFSLWAQVDVDETEQSFIIDNQQIKIEISKQGDVLSLFKDNENLVKNLKGVSRDPNHDRSFYLDYHTGVSGGATNFYPTDYKILAQIDEKFHIAFYGTDKDHIYLEYHYIIDSKQSGLYSYVIAGNKSEQDVRVAELRTVYRFDRDLMPQMFSGDRLGKPESYAFLEKQPFIQDETWKLPDGSIYTKYDFSYYMRESQVWGVLGDKFAVWMIPASHDYFSGDDLNQELMVHQDAIFLNYLTGAHMGTPDLIAPKAWEKLYGPWFIYVDSDENSEKLLINARKKAEVEKEKWPYTWMNESLYPLQREQVNGIVDAKTQVKVVLSSDQLNDFSQQTLGYFYSAQTDEAGKFTIEHVRPGDYKLSVYALSGTETGILYEEDISINNENKFLNITIPTPKHQILWQIGEANRRADEFKFANQDRNFQWAEMVPSSLEFIVGESDEKEDWYYAQTKQGIWKIKFNLKEQQIKDSVLNIALAAASNSGMKSPTSPKLVVILNGTPIKTLEYSNDKAIYRSALQSGRYHSEKIDIPASSFVHGENNLEFKLEGGALMYDTVNLVQ